MFSICYRDRIVEYRRPAVMGIINAGPDSFYSGARGASPADAALLACKMLEQGADIIDIGACSTRPGAEVPDAAEEWLRLLPVLEAVREAVGPDAVISVDTFRASVACSAVEKGLADMVNDVSGATLDEKMIDTVAGLRVPYVLTHMRGTPATMQSCTDYGADGVAAVVLRELAATLDRLTLAGVADVVVDPGFGFAKTMEQNYALLAALPAFVEALGRPVLAGLSRKSMITRLLGIPAEDALPATSALNMAALERGASILRVHDVAEAVQVVKIFGTLKNTSVCPTLE
ncbi:MAG: dihydropteroate synthase [Muribaculaceae bacterium]|nr:dihydropteroate synthase [Muribaculaceae bacterium]